MYVPAGAKLGIKLANEYSIESPASKFLPNYDVCLSKKAPLSLTTKSTLLKVTDAFAVPD